MAKIAKRQTANDKRQTANGQQQASIVGGPLEALERTLTPKPYIVELHRNFHPPKAANFLRILDLVTEVGSLELICRSMPLSERKSCTVTYVTARSGTIVHVLGRAFTIDNDSRLANIIDGNSRTKEEGE